MQRRTQLESRSSSSSHGPRVLDTTYTPLMSNAAAMLRRWLRELAALLRDHPMGEQIPLLLERAMVAISKNKDEDEPNNNTGGYPRPCKKRRILNMIEIARTRLQDLADDEGEDGYNTHQIRASLEESLRDLDRGRTPSAGSQPGNGGTKCNKGCTGWSRPERQYEKPWKTPSKGTLTGLRPVGGKLWLWCCKKQKSSWKKKGSSTMSTQQTLWH